MVLSRFFSANEKISCADSVDIVGKVLIDSFITIDLKIDLF
jgi:hypothetical protein